VIENVQRTAESVTVTPNCQTRIHLQKFEYFENKEFHLLQDPRRIPYQKKYQEHVRHSEEEKKIGGKKVKRKNNVAINTSKGKIGNMELINLNRHFLY